MQINEEYYLYKIKEELKRRKKFNPAYSLRSFAKDLDINSSNLSAILKNKRRIPKSRIDHFVTKLKLTYGEEKLFKSSIYKKIKGLDALKIEDQERFYLLDEIYAKVIAEWEYYAVLNLLKLEDFQSCHSWMAKKLGIEEERVETVISDLISLNLIASVNSKYIRLVKRLESSEDIASKALQDSHLEVLEIAKRKLKETKIEDRDFSSMTFAINKKRLKEAKSLIREFEDKLSVLFEKDQNKDDVYIYSGQLFSLTKEV